MTITDTITSEPKATSTTPQPRQTSAKSVVVVGLGNIGSPLVNLLSSLPNLENVTLIDRDVYELSNRCTQGILPSDIGKPKAQAKANWLSKARPDLNIKTIVAQLEQIPLGEYRVDAVVSCLDSRIARQYLNEFTRKLGVPLLDSGVAGHAMLARVTVSRNLEESPCLECAWTERDYASLEQTYPCKPEQTSAPATNASSALGTLTAAMLAIELEKVLADDWANSADGYQILLDAKTHNYYKTRIPVNRDCRCSHELWDLSNINSVRSDMTIRQAFEINEACSLLEVPGKRFIRQIVCPACGWQQHIFRLTGRFTNKQQACQYCNRTMLPVGFSELEYLDMESLSESSMERRLAEVGLKTGDIITIGNETHHSHFEIIGEQM